MSLVTRKTSCVDCAKAESYDETEGCRQSRPEGRAHLARRCSGRSRPSPAFILHAHESKEQQLPLPILNGLRILDLTHFLAGPAVTRLIADLGAEIIKVESIQHFDGSRPMNTPPGPGSHELSAAYNFFNANKQGITLDLKNARGVALALELASVCDAVIENFPTGTIDRLGLDAATLRRANPSIVIISMAGYGQVGPWSQYPSFATTLAMLGGAYEMTGRPGSQPTTPNVGGVDPMNGVLGANALMMALMRRRRTGHGVHIDYAQLEATTSLLGEAVADSSVNRRVAQRRGNHHPVAAPHGIYPCREEESWISIAVFDDAQFRSLCDVMDRPDLAADPRFDSPASRRDNIPELDESIAEWTREQEQYDVVSQLQTRGIASGVVHSSKSIWHDPHLQSLGMIEEVERPISGKKGNMRPELGLSGERSPTRPAPTLGQHNKWAFGELLAHSTDEIEALERDQVIGTDPLTTRV